MYSKEMLNKLKKSELIDLLLSLNPQIPSRSDTLFSNLDNGVQKWKRFSINININANILKVNTIYLTPSGYGDNGLRDNFEIILNDDHLLFLSKNTIKDFMIKYLKFNENLISLHRNVLPYKKP